MSSRSEFALHFGRYSTFLVLGVSLLALICILTLNSGAYAEEREFEFSRLDHVASEIESFGLVSIENEDLVSLLASTSVGGHPIHFVDSTGHSSSGEIVRVDHAEFESARTDTYGWRLEESKSATLVLVRSIELQSEVVGFLTVRIPAQAIIARGEKIRRSIIVGSSLVLLLGFFAAYLLARRQAHGVESLRQYISSLAGGAHEFEAPPLPSWELEDCVKSLGIISQEIVGRIQRGARNKKELETILTSMGEGLLATNLDGRMILMNEPAKHILGMGALTPMPPNLIDLPHGPELVPFVQGAIESGLITAEEIEFEEDDSIVELQVAPLRDENKDIGGAVTLLSDVTAMRRLENMRREFVANVSHELKTPITAIQGSAETILNDEDMPDAIRNKFLTRIVENSLRLDRLINDVLQLSRLQSGRQHLNKAAIDLAGIVRDCISHLEPNATRKSIDLTSDFDDGRTYVFGDAQAIHSVVENLVSNAINYSPSGGRVLVRVLVDSNDVVLEVKDSGVGIPPDHQERIFERFYRVDSARSREVGGTGLGLAIVKNSVQAHGGHVELESQVGVGSTFRVRFPQQTES